MTIQLATTDVGGTGLTSFTANGAMYASSTSVLTTGTLPVLSGGTGLTTLTAGYIPYGNGTSAFGSSSNLFWDSTNNRLGIGTSSPSWPLQVQTSASDAQIYLTSTGTNNSGQYIANGNGTGSYPAYNLYQSGTNYWSFMMRGDTNLYLWRQSGSGNVYIPSGSLNLTSGTAIYNSSGRPMVNQTGGVLQTISYTSSTTFSTASSSATATGFIISITPSSTSSKILFMLFGGNQNYGTGSQNSEQFYIYRQIGSGGYTNIQYYSGSLVQGSTWGTQHSAAILDTPATTSTVYYQPYMLSTGPSNVGYFNNGGTFTMILMEIAG